MIEQNITSKARPLLCHQYLGQPLGYPGNPLNPRRGLFFNFLELI
jgi:hypothetical protein